MKTRICTNCKHEFEVVGLDTMRICKKCNCERVKSLSIETKMRNRAQQRARKTGIEFNLNKEDIHVPDICPILGIELICHTGKPGGRKQSPALDRIDSNKGYTKDNIQVISHLANQMKSHATPAEMLKFAEWVISNYKSLDKE